MSHWEVGRERLRWEPQVAEVAETFLRRLGLGVSQCRMEGPVREFTPQGESRYIVFPLSSFLRLLLSHRKVTKKEGRWEVVIMLKSISDAIRCNPTFLVILSYTGLFLEVSYVYQ